MEKGFLKAPQFAGWLKSLYRGLVGQVRKRNVLETEQTRLARGGGEGGAGFDCAGTARAVLRDQPRAVLRLHRAPFCPAGQSVLAGPPGGRVHRRTARAGRG